MACICQDERRGRICPLSSIGIRAPKRYVARSSPVSRSLELTTYKSFANMQSGANKVNKRFLVALSCGKCLGAQSPGICRLWYRFQVQLEEHVLCSRGPIRDPADVPARGEGAGTFCN